MRSEFEQYRAENAELVQELSAVNHHRTVLRDTIEQLDREVREKVDMLTDLQASVGAHSAHQRALDASYLGAAEGDDALHRQLMRYKARAAAVDNLATIYRTSVLALYSDGASYGAAQFGGAPGSTLNTQGMQLIGRLLCVLLSLWLVDVNYGVFPRAIKGVGWIEREMTAVKHSYEDEVRLLDAEVAELRAKQRQSTSYIQELQKRFEETVRSVYR
jgi:chromosome segregation ATPase